jgi:hypothetical protein
VLAGSDVLTDKGVRRRPPNPPRFLPPVVVALFGKLGRELPLVHSEQAEAYAAGPATPGMEKKSDRKEDGKAAGFVVSGN